MKFCLSSVVAFVVYVAHASFGAHSDVLYGSLPFA